MSLTIFYYFQKLVFFAITARLVLLQHTVGGTQWWPSMPTGQRIQETYPAVHAGVNCCCGVLHCNTLQIQTKIHKEERGICGCCCDGFDCKTLRGQTTTQKEDMCFCCMLDQYV